VSSGQTAAIHYYEPIHFANLQTSAPLPTVPAGSARAASSADAPLSGGGSGNTGGVSGGGEALLAIAVLVVAAAPVVVYALDSEAPPLARRKWECPSFDVKLLGGTVNGPDASRFAPVGGLRTSFGVGPLGADFAFESTPQMSDVSSFDFHLLLRPPPKQHVEGAVAVGFRRQVFGGAERNAFELGLPHHYVLTRVGAHPMSVDLHPAVAVGERGLDFRLETGLTIPVGLASFQLGARLFSFDQHVRAGFFGGVGLAL
jgi:hypothetical protein